MTPEQLKSIAQIFDNEKSNQWRNRYIGRFLNVKSDFYKNHIEKLQSYSDGQFYDGYLWDCIQYPKIISPDGALFFLNNINTNVLVMWDLHSSKKIHVPNYWIFPVHSVIELNSLLLAQSIGCFPEDIYIFDHDVSWSTVLTHEYTSSGVRICVQCGQPPEL